MRVLLTSLNKKHAFNPIVQRLFDPLSDHYQFYRDISPEDADAVFLSFIAAEPEFDLDSEALNSMCVSGKPVVIFDHSETVSPQFALGFSELHESSYYWPVHCHLLEHQWKIKAYFKREMRVNQPMGLPIPHFPIDWTIPTVRQYDGIDTRRVFETRPIDIFMSWGYSSESRPRLFGELMKQAGRFGAHFCLHEEDLERAIKDGRERIFALLFAPWYRRIDLDKLFRWQSRAKISLSIKGAGYKCFRTAESCYNSVMAQQGAANMAWSYPWISGENCISLPNADDGEIDIEASMEVLWHWLRDRQGALYDIYTRGIINNRNYHSNEYSRDYLLPKLQEALKCKA